ncbi:Pro-kumamolisin, activation domain-containing protein [Hypoxylon cercidicola]|nr:Pro-kumamolisin, activation domain-containing protein [Hypoxylon cercidicola]
MQVSFFLSIQVASAAASLSSSDYVLHPASLNYGKYYTAEQVNELFAPAAEIIQIVREWLETSGVSGHRTSQSANKAWLQFDADTEEAERLLKTKYHIFEQADTGSKKVACDKLIWTAGSKTSPLKFRTEPTQSSEAWTAASRPASRGAGIESYLDLQITYPLLHPQSIVLYQAEYEVYSHGDFDHKGLFNNFLDDIDGSYCTYSAYGETGNNPDYD